MHSSPEEVTAVSTHVFGWSLPIYHNCSPDLEGRKRQEDLQLEERIVTAVDFISAKTPKTVALSVADDVADKTSKPNFANASNSRSMRNQLKIEISAIAAQ